MHVMVSVVESVLTYDTSHACTSISTPSGCILDTNPMAYRGELKTNWVVYNNYTASSELKLIRTYVNKDL